MSKKRKEETQSEAVTAEQVMLTVTAEHIASPHSIELRRNGGKFVIEAQINDHAHRQVIGATPVEDILRNAGLPFPDGQHNIILTFSPHNGDLILGQAAGNGAEPPSEPADDSDEADASDENADE